MESIKKLSLASDRKSTPTGLNTEWSPLRSRVRDNGLQMRLYPVTQYNLQRNLILGFHLILLLALFLV